MKQKDSSSELLKQASGVIHQLQNDNLKLSEKYASLEAANAVAFSLFTEGNLAADDLELYIKEASTKKLSELSLIKEAARLSSKNSETFGLSDQNDYKEKEYDITSYLLNS